jgi:hypothetical protein
MIAPFRTKLNAFAVGCMLVFSPVAAPAQDADAATLFQTLRLPEIIAIMREEGLDYAEQIGNDLFGNAPPANWSSAVDRIYDAQRMEARVQSALEEAAAEIELGPIIAFFSAEPGAGFLELELSARRALLDDDVEQMAKETAAAALADGGALVTQVERFVAANDLVETNLVGALNSTYAFFTGLMEGGGFPAEMTESDILADVWGQEDQIRASTEEWIYAFLLMAYGPADAGDIEAYIAFSESEAGQTANRLVFGAFDGMFEEISRALGQTASRFMMIEDL